MRVFLTNLGCKLNQAETERFARSFLAAGHELAPRLEDADLHVVNSCTVTHVAARDSRKTARRAGRLERPVRTVLTGCYVASNPEEAARLVGVDLVVPNDAKDELVNRVHAAFPEAVPDLSTDLPVPYVPLSFGHARAMVKIGDGCNMRCSFCIIPFTRGRESSRSIPEVVEEVRSLARGGYREVVITGVQISSYRWNDVGLHELVSAVLAETEVERLRLTSIAPWDFDERLVAQFEDPRVCRHVHVSLQSGSSATLRRMRRPYTAESFAALVGDLRRSIPGLAVTTDVIVGFPGEDETEFAESLAFVDEVGFARTHVFPYSTREGTAAASMPGEVSPPVKKERMASMLEVAALGAERFSERHLGETVEVLWEGERGGVWFGITDNYLRVSARSDEELRGRIAPVRLVALDGSGLVGELAVCAA